jgi:DNA replication protein DnaC
LISPLKAVQVLYIDDLFKPVYDDRGVRRQPSPGDISLAFEIINSRYIAGPSGVTIISSEWTMDELQRIDPATAGRIFQKAQDYCISITPGKGRNYRLRRQKP